MTNQYFRDALDGMKHILNLATLEGRALVLLQEMGNTRMFSCLVIINHRAVVANTSTSVPSLLCNDSAFNEACRLQFCQVENLKSGTIRQGRSLSVHSESKMCGVIALNELHHLQFYHGLQFRNSDTVLSLEMLEV
ncbi:Protein of unknown function [Gryllus bimaculatus]|nr:Protein of unknown function [Gryllus bimaculatus]